MNPKQLAEERITVDPKVCSGKPCIKGTRITIADILLALAEGLSEKDILRNFRTIRREDIAASLAYAYCLCDQVSLNVKTSSGGSVLVENDVAQQEFLEEEAKKQFSAMLEKQAAAQEEITEKKISKLKEEKEKSAVPKSPAPTLKPYDLELELAAADPVRVFTDKDSLEQGLNMKSSNYVFERRNDGKSWLTYSEKDGVEIDKNMKRNIKLKYPSKSADAIDGFREAVCEGYLTTDRLVKVFIEKSEDGKSLGRAL